MRWTYWAALVRRRIRYKITRGGILFVLALIVVATDAAISANNLLFLIVAAMFATFSISGLVSRLVLAGLELELMLPEHVSARTKTRAVFRLRNWKRWMPSFSIRVAGTGPENTLIEPIYFPVLPGGSKTRRGRGPCLSPSRRTYRKSLRLHHAFPLWLPGKNRHRAAEARNRGLPLY